MRTRRWLTMSRRQVLWAVAGPAGAFHPSAGWYDPNVLGIDQGISVLIAENLRTGFVWSTFMQNPEVRQAMTPTRFYATTSSNGTR